MTACNEPHVLSSGDAGDGGDSLSRHRNRMSPTPGRRWGTLGTGIRRRVICPHVPTLQLFCGDADKYGKCRVVPTIPLVPNEAKYGATL